MSDLSLVGIALGIVCGLVAVVYGLLRKADDRTEQRLDEHVRSDMEAHERLARVETQVEINTGEIKSVRDRTHKLEADAAYKRFKDRHDE